MQGAARMRPSDGRKRVAAAFAQKGMGMEQLRSPESDVRAVSRRRILVCDDEREIADMVARLLEREGFFCLACYDPFSALDAIRRNEADLAILDIMMPGSLDGLAVCKELRQKNATIGIIMLTAKTQEMDKVTGLMMGADDYVTKPFSPSELVARVDAVYRRVAQFTRAAEPNFSEELRSGRFVLNLRNRSFTKDGNPVELTQVEFQIMEYFISNAGKALKRSEILKHVWGSGYVGEEKIVDVNIRRLRMKIEDEPSNPRHVVTVWGIGYRWDK